MSFDSLSPGAMPITMRLEHAIRLACEVHFGQVDKAGQPYILHCFRVMNLVEDADQETLQKKRIVAVLHDALEDTVQPGWMEARIACFGDDILAAVKTLTRIPEQDYLREYIPRVMTNPLAKEVKLMDLTDNLDPKRIPIVSQEDIERTKKYRRAFHMLFMGPMEVNVDPN